MEKKQLTHFLDTVRRLIDGEDPKQLIAAMPPDISAANHDQGFYGDDDWCLAVLLLDDWRFEYYERFAEESPELADMVHDWDELLDEAEDHMPPHERAHFLNKLKAAWADADRLRAASAV